MFALIPFSDYPFYPFLAFSITSLAFLWYRSSKSSQSSKEQSQAAWTCQPYDAFLVLDVEATCLQGTDFHWPNEIIVSYRIELCSPSLRRLQEWPVCLLKWADREHNGKVGPLQKVAEFRSFVKPTWRPELSSFCVSLTGITQVSAANSITSPTHIETRMSSYLGTGR